MSSPPRLLAPLLLAALPLLPSVASGETWVRQPVPWHEAATAALGATDTVALSLSYDGSARWWSLPGLTPLGVAPWEPAERARVAVAPDGQSAALLAGAGELLVLRRDGGTRALDPGGRVTALAWVGGALVAGRGDGALRRWGEAGDPLTVTGEEGVTALAVSPGGKLAVGRGDEFGHVEVRDGGTLALVRVMTLGTATEPAHPSAYILPPHSLAWGGEERLAAGGAEATIWDAGTGLVLQTAAKREAGRDFDGVGVSSLAFAGDTLWTATDGAIAGWHLPTGAARGSFPAPPNWNPAQPTIALRPDAGWVLTGDIHGGLELRGLDGHLLTEPVGLRAGVHSLSMAPGAAVLAVGHDDGTLTLWSGSPLRPVGAPIPLHRHAVSAVAFSPGGDLLATAGGGEAVVWSLRGDRAPAVLPLTSPARDLAWAPDGGLIAVAEASGPVRAFSAAGVPVAGWGGHERGAAAVAWGPEGRLASAGEDGVVRIWEAGRAEPLRATKQEMRVYTAIAWSADGATVATTEAFFGPGPVRLWDAATLAPLRELPAGELGCADVGFGPPGRLVAACLDSVAHVWSLPDGAEEAAFRGFDGYGLAALLSPCGDLLVLGTGGQERALRVWDRVPSAP